MTEMKTQKSIKVILLIVFAFMFISCSKEAPDEPAVVAAVALPEPVAAGPYQLEDAAYVGTSQLKAGAIDDKIDIAAHAYQLFDTSTDASSVSGLLAGLHTYVLITENNESATGLLEALYGSVRPLAEVQQEYSISQINVFHLPISSEYAETMRLLDPDNPAAVQEIFAYEWSAGVIRTICEASIEERACGEISEGPYLVTTMYPIEAENARELSPENFLVLDLSTVPEDAWTDMLDIYKSFLLEAETLSGVRSAIENESADNSERGEQALRIVAGSLRRFAELWGGARFDETVALNLLKTITRCWRTWDGKIVCNE